MKNRALLLILTSVLAAAPAFGEDFGTMRCGTGLVSIGSSAGEVLKKCGEPTYSSKREETKVVLDPLTGARTYATTAIDDWMYNFGPDRFQYRVVLENGIVARIESLDKGY